MPSWVITARVAASNAARPARTSRRSPQRRRTSRSREYQVERLFREAILARIAPVTEQLILSFISERVLRLPKSY